MQTPEQQLNEETPKEETKLTREQLLKQTAAQSVARSRWATVASLRTSSNAK